MTLTITCPVCGELVFDLMEKHRGSGFPCSQCGAALFLPGQMGEADESSLAAVGEESCRQSGGANHGSAQTQIDAASIWNDTSDDTDFEIDISALGLPAEGGSSTDLPVGDSSLIKGDSAWLIELAQRAGNPQSDPKLEVATAAAPTAQDAKRTALSSNANQSPNANQSSSGKEGPTATHAAIAPPQRQSPQAHSLPDPDASENRTAPANKDSLAETDVELSALSGSETGSDSRLPASVIEQNPSTDAVAPSDIVTASEAETVVSPREARRLAEEQDARNRMMRILISTGPDVAEERTYASWIVDRLCRTLSDVVDLNVTIWDHCGGPAQPDALLGPDVDVTSADFVICVLGNRLGQRFPEQQAPALASSYGSATEYEFRTAIDRLGPAAFVVFRRQQPIIPTTSDETERLALQACQRELDAVLDGWCGPGRPADGSLLVLERSSDFAAELEALLRDIVQARIEEFQLQPRESVEKSATCWWSTGSPFRGFKAFSEAEARVFHGREQLTGELLNRLRERSAAGLPCVMLEGPSGSGKTSLVQAGLIPLLTSPYVVAGSSQWRRMILRADDFGHNLVEGFAAALLQYDVLPEIVRDGTSPQKLVQLLHKNPQAGCRLIHQSLLKLDSSDPSGRLTGRSHLGQLRPHLLIVVDALEEIFLQERFTADDRQALFTILAGLVRQGEIWVVTTMRDDLSSLCAESSQLLQLRSGAGVLGMTAPSVDEMRRMVSVPSEGAGLWFGRNPSTSAWIDEQLVEEASQFPGELYRLQFALHSLYERRTQKGKITQAVYDEIGGVAECVEVVAEQTMNRLPEEVQATLPQLAIRSVLVTEPDLLTVSQSTALDAFRQVPELMQLVDALTAAGLVEQYRKLGGMTLVRLAHVELFNNWPRLQVAYEDALQLPAHDATFIAEDNAFSEDSSVGADRLAEPSDATSDWTPIASDPHTPGAMAAASKSSVTNAAPRVADDALAYEVPSEEAAATKSAVDLASADSLMALASDVDASKMESGEVDPNELTDVNAVQAARRSRQRRRLALFAALTVSILAGVSIVLPVVRQLVFGKSVPGNLRMDSGDEAGLADASNLPETSTAKQDGTQAARSESRQASREQLLAGMKPNLGTPTFPADFKPTDSASEDAISGTNSPMAAVTSPAESPGSVIEKPSPVVASAGTAPAEKSPPATTTVPQPAPTPGTTPAPGTAPLPGIGARNPAVASTVSPPVPGLRLPGIAPVPRPSVPLPTPTLRAPQPVSSPLADNSPRLEKKLQNSIGISFVLIPAGKFQMGSPATEAERRPDEQLHTVTISRPYYLGMHEVTQAQYQQVIGKNPSGFKGKTMPVENVSWSQAEEFCRQLSLLPEEQSARRSYRLPTEAEWEYACRGGTQTPFSFGAVGGSRDANFDGTQPYQDAAEGPDLQGPTRVGSYRPNAYGLYDMHGNVAEWCQDWFSREAVADAVSDPAGPPTGQRRVLRGGSWLSGGADCRSAWRGSEAPDRFDSVIGFRIVCEIQTAPEVAGDEPPASN